MAPVLIVLVLCLQAQDPKPVPADPLKAATKDKSAITFYGFIRLDIVYDTDRPNNTQIPMTILPDTGSGPGGESDFTMHPRLTRFGFDLDAGTVDPLDAQVTGKVEVDFYQAASPASNSRETLRMRHAWVKLQWEDFSLLAGQREDIASPLAPTVNNDFVMWNAGNTGDRRPQVRVEYAKSGFTITGGIGLTGADDGAVDGSYLRGEISSLPTIQLRAGYEFDGWVEKKTIKVGGWVHFAKEDLDTPVGGEDSFTSTMFGIDAVIPVHDRVTLYLEFWTGTNLDDVRGGIGQGVAGVEEIDATGGWIEVQVKVSDVWTPLLGIYMDDPDDEFLAAGAPDKNFTIAFGNRMKFGPITIGADYLNWKTEYVNSSNDGTDNRFNFFIQYNF